MSGDAIGVAVIGAGAWGKNHVRAFAGTPGADLLWVCDRRPEARALAEEMHPGVRTAESFAEAFEDPRVRAVVVATEAPSHASVARQVLEAGRDVLVEKPLALTGADAEGLCSLAERSGRILMVGHLLLYHPAIERLRAIIDAGELGEILYITCQRLNLGVVRRDENAWWSLAPHDISLASHLLASEPEAVSAVGGAFLQRDRNIEDVVFGTLHYPGGRLVHVHVSWLDPHKTRRLTVVGSKKMAVFDDMSADHKLSIFDKGVLPPPSVPYGESIRVRTGDIHIPAVKMSEPLRRECEAFVEAVRTRQAPKTDGRSGLSVVRALEAGERSLREAGRRVVLGGQGSE